ncbi:GNAT family N-acetyltransferase [Nonomuraea sp. NPDC049028]|uniref:GNAT family N-acetyltransferase n=1 Tax=Nonomuraea sp. NPDC049028 TaxID=3364348 RepID=UPI00371A2591
MRIRPAELADSEAIAVAHVRSWQAAYQGLVPQEYLDRMTSSQRQPVWERLLAETSWPWKGILVAEFDGSVAGFTGFGPTRDRDENSATVAEITTIYLAPEFWGAGVGRQLMTTALETMAQAGYEKATLWVLEANVRARRFYEINGWHSDGSVKQDETRGFLLTEIRYRRVVN